MANVGRGVVLRQLGRLFGEGTLAGLGDGPLLERYLTHRDEDAFAALVDRLGPMVLGLCRRMLRDPVDVEDAFQATFLVLVRRATAIRDRDRVSSWLYGVAYRVASRARSRTIRRRTRESGADRLDVAADPVATDRDELAATLDRELSGLPERYRAPLVLCYLRGQTHEQAAAELRCPVGTVRSRMARGREILRKRLESRGFASSAIGALLTPDPFRSLLVAVPTPMAAATVRAALAFGASSIVQAGAAAAGAAVLARGVLTTMKLAQLQWLGAAAIVTGLSAGGVVAVGSATATGNGPQAAQAPDEPKGKPADAASKADPALGEFRPNFYTLDSRLKAMEDKIDKLSGQMGSTAGGPSEEIADRLKVLEGKIDQLAGQPGKSESPNASPESLEAELNNRLNQYRRLADLVKQHAVEPRLADEAKDQLLTVAGRVSAASDQAADELERSLIEHRRKKAMLDKARAEEQVATSAWARDQELNQRKPGIIAPQEVAKHVGEYKVAAASTQIAKADVDDVELRIRQWSRRCDHLAEAAKLAERARKEAVK